MSSFGDAILWLLAAVGLGPAPDQVFNGYLEADYVYVAPVSAGRIVAIPVTEGLAVQAGQQLATLENTSQAAQLQAALAAVAVAQATLENLQTGSREDEIEVIRASLHKAEADQRLARLNLDRASQLLAQGRVPQAEVDQLSAALQSADAQMEQLAAQLRVAQLPARQALVLAAQATLDQRRAEADLARVNLSDRVLTAPVGGVIEKLFFDAGEVAATGAPVVSILPEGAISAIFFIPEPDRAGFAVGDALTLACDGCPEGLTASITRLASDPQYAPPILYSRDERARLVFRAEASVSQGKGLLPGQPVTLARK
ncbi:HlyD family secretion protein [Rhodobacter ferrooxidans]|uniref:Secretion protein HlyD family protein n=1 Tax=Rhodobacter ferrooxidans TaxID=371731 RepID=C8S4C4_9RHOB|nr:HlyD family efflux transporter periplasmic adaptor subunit [Rhodobacter sp. SW2]EEW24183.1 secretion protein HlyD family protein [Rhodobacter sp. SW2]